MLTNIRIRISFHRGMDRDGRDALITSQGFSSLIYGPQNQSNSSVLTVHAQIEPVQSAVVILPTHPDSLFIVDLNDIRMGNLESWTEVNQTREIHVQNCYNILTGSDPNAVVRIIIEDESGITTPSTSGSNTQTTTGTTASTNISTTSHVSGLQTTTGTTGCFQ